MTRAAQARRRAEIRNEPSDTMSGTPTTAPSCALTIEHIARLVPPSPRNDRNYLRLVGTFERLTIVVSAAGEKASGLVRSWNILLRSLHDDYRAGDRAGRCGDRQSLRRCMALDVRRDPAAPGA